MFGSNGRSAVNARKKAVCTRAKERSLGFASQENHLILEEFRESENDAQWQKLYARRAGIKGTFSQAVRAFGLRRSRYIGKRKTHLHNLATASAINIGRSIAWLDEKPREKTRVSWLGRLKHLEL